MHHKQHATKGSTRLMQVPLNAFRVLQAHLLHQMNQLIVNTAQMDGFRKRQVKINVISQMMEPFQLAVPHQWSYQKVGTVQTVVLTVSAKDRSRVLKAHMAMIIERVVLHAQEALLVLRGQCRAFHVRRVSLGLMRKQPNVENVQLGSFNHRIHYRVHRA